MKLLSFTSILFKSTAIFAMLVALLAQPIIQTIDLVFDTDVELANLDSQQEQEEEKQEKEKSDEKIELFAYESQLDEFYFFLDSKNHYSHDLLWDFSLEITIPPPDYI